MGVMASPFNESGPLPPPTLPGWQRLSLLQRFALVTLLVLLINLCVVGWWVGEAIKAGVVNRTAASTSLYVENFIATQFQAQTPLSPERAATLNRLLGPEYLGEDVVAVRVWGSGGQVLYGANVGATFPVEADQARAWRGEVVSHISSLRDPHNAELRAGHTRLLETYAPIRLKESGQVVAVIEFYRTIDSVSGEVRAAQVQG